MLEQLILPTFEMVKKLEAEGKVLAGGFPVGERAVVIIAEADSNEEMDIMLRGLPLWPMLEWEVTPLQSFEGRMEFEREFIKRVKGA